MFNEARSPMVHAHDCIKESGSKLPQSHDHGRIFGTLLKTIFYQQVPFKLEGDVEDVIHSNK